MRCQGNEAPGASTENSPAHSAPGAISH
jgi:hypothetical protein